MKLHKKICNTLQFLFVLYKLCSRLQFFKQLFTNYSVFQEDLSFSGVVIGKYGTKNSPISAVFRHEKSTGTTRCLILKLLKINK